MNGAAGRRMSGATSLTIRGVQAEALLANIPDVAISTGSACNSGAPEPSHVLTAIGLDREDAYATIRASVGRFTSEDDVVYAADRVVATALRLRAMAD
jgi:cysteine desulfurase